MNSRPPERPHFEVFFSYARASDRNFAIEYAKFRDRLIKTVNEPYGAGKFDFWVDRDNLRLGEQWHPDLLAGLAQCDALMIMLTADWLRSRYCGEEFERFIEAKAAANSTARVIWVQLGDVLAPDVDMSARLDRLRGRNGYQGIAIRRDQLTDAIGKPDEASRLDRVLAPLNAKLIAMVKSAAVEPSTGTLAVSDPPRPYDATIGAATCTFVDIPGGVQSFQSSGGLRPVDFADGFAISAAPIDTAFLADALGTGESVASNALAVDAAIDRLRHRTRGLRLASESQWHHAMTARQSSPATALQPNRWGVLPPPPGARELVADNYEGAVRGIVPHDGGAASAATIHRVALSLVDAEVRRDKVRERDEIAGLAFRLVMKRKG